jgi:hypothetical protein
MQIEISIHLRREWWYMTRSLWLRQLRLVTKSSKCVYLAREAICCLRSRHLRPPTADLFPCMLQGCKYFIKRNPNRANPSWERLDLQHRSSLAVVFDISMYDFGMPVDIRTSCVHSLWLTCSVATSKSRVSADMRTLFTPWSSNANSEIFQSHPKLMMVGGLSTLLAVP